MVAAILSIFAYWKITQHIGFNNSSFGMFCQIFSVCLYEPSTNGLGRLILRIPAGPKFLSTTIMVDQKKSDYFDISFKFNLLPVALRCTKWPGPSQRDCHTLVLMALVERAVS